MNFSQIKSLYNEEKTLYYQFQAYFVSTRSSDMLHDFLPAEKNEHGSEGLVSTETRPGCNTISVFSN